MCMQKLPGGAKAAHRIGVFCIIWVIAEKNVKDGYKQGGKFFREGGFQSKIYDICLYKKRKIAFFIYWTSK